MGTMSRPGTGSGATWTVRVALGVGCAVWTIPVIGTLINSFRTRDAQRSTGWWTAIVSPLDVTQWTLDNYRVTLFTTSADGVNMGESFVNSLLVTLPATVIPLLIAAFAAYAFTFMEWRGRGALFMVFVCLLIVPAQVALVPLLKIYGAAGLTGTFLGMWLVHVAFGMPLAVYILRSYMSWLPRQVIECARVDGASHFTAFWRLVIPMSVPAFVSVAILQFVGVWGDLLIALLFLGRGENATATVALQSLHGQDISGTELIPSAAIVTVVVPVLAALALRNHVVRGLTSAAVTESGARPPQRPPSGPAL
jgi:alpha-glucoside transport system permease protein